MGLAWTQVEVEVAAIPAFAAAPVEMRAEVEERVLIQVAAAERVESRVAAVRVWIPALVALDAFLVEAASGE
ncbi:MAG TPA: hypothetical protein VIJ53_18465 [Acidobacteriaceae bacterium]